MDTTNTKRRSNLFLDLLEKFPILGLAIIVAGAAGGSLACYLAMGGVL